MSRKNYKAFAELLKGLKDGEVSHLYMTQKIAFLFKQDNPRFDGYKFSKACGYDFNVTL